MGVEIRLVPAYWNHPTRYERSNPRHLEFQPMRQQFYLDAAEEWLKDCIAWANKTHPEYDPAYPYYWDYDSPSPEKAYYAPYKKEECGWFQLYETVTEGTPLSPPFLTARQLIHHLCSMGDSTGYKWDLYKAQEFVERELTRLGY